MPRRLRKDYPGAWHHVMSRGIARRPLFEGEADVRFFLSCLARRVREGDIELHAYSILTTHFHLLVRSPRGRLSAAMQRALDAYARWFNRRRRRDGPLFRGRFVNRIIESERYFVVALRYVDDNPVKARLVTDATEYPHGSAWHYARPAGPPWLNRTVVEELLDATPGRPWDPASYRAFAAEGASPGERWLVERRLHRASFRDEDALDDLVASAPSRVREWMIRKATLADGPESALPVASPRAVAAAVEAMGSEDAATLVAVGGLRAPLGEILAAGLLRHAAGLRIEEIALHLSMTKGTARNRVQLYGQAVAGVPFVGERGAEILAGAIEREARPLERRASGGWLPSGAGGPPSRTVENGSRSDDLGRVRYDEV